MMAKKIIYICFIFCLGVLPVNASIDIEQLSLREKIGQMLIIGFDGAKVTEQSGIIQAIKRDNLGGVILFDYNFQTQTFEKNISSPKQVKILNHSLQQAAQEGDQKHHRPDLPLLISVDYEGGKVNRLKPNYGFPETFSAQKFATLSQPQAQQEALQMAHTLKNSGFNGDFAPVLDESLASLIAFLSVFISTVSLTPPIAPTGRIVELAPSRPE